MSTEQKYELRFWKMTCDGQTESGRDEPYMIATSAFSNGQTQHNRVPGPGESDHWEMGSNHDQFHEIGDHLVAHGTLQPNESVKIVVALMEADGGTSKPWTELAAQILTRTGDATLVAVGSIIGTIGAFINFHNADDYIGSFAAIIRNTGGQISTQWTPIDYVVDSIPRPDDDGRPNMSLDNNRHGFRMIGAGANYVGWFYVKN